MLYGAPPVKKHELTGSKAQRAGTQTVPYETVNILWQTDGTQGPYLKIQGKKADFFWLSWMTAAGSSLRPAFLLQKTEDLMKVFEEAFSGGACLK